MTIYNKLVSIGRGLKKYSGEIGLEIETETKKKYNIPDFFFWCTENDGSLRDFGVEYILKQPVDYRKEFPEALNEWFDKTKKIDFIRNSISTSVHVHLNMLPETFKTLGNFLTLYTLVENILIRYSGPDRLSNLFCLPICDAEVTAYSMETMFKSLDNKNYRALLLPENSVKYAACNLASLGMYGSIEIRSFRGETSPEKIHKWVDILYNIYEFAKGDVTPKQIMELWQKNNLELLDIVFKENRKELKTNNEMELIAKNTWYAAMVAYAIKDWSAVDEPEKVPIFKPSAKALFETSMKQYNLPFDALGDVDKNYILFLLEKDFKRKNKMITMDDIADGIVRARVPDRLQDLPPVVDWQALRGRDV